MDRRYSFFLVILVAAASPFTGGCANRYKQRIVLLEEVNRILTERANAMGSDLDAAARDREEVERQLQQAMDDAAVIRGELAQRPTEPQTPQGWTPVPGGAMIAIEGGVLFAPGKVAIRKEARGTLDAVASAIRGEYADKDILVVGHTDDQPIKKSGWLDNYELGAARALAVVRYLVDHGVASPRLIGGGCGEHRPRVANSSDENRAANRRVEIFATTPFPRTTRP